MSDAYRKGVCIGRGSFGQVYKGVVKETGQVVALKLQDLEKAADEIDIIRREVQVMSEISSEYVVRYYSSFIEGSTLWLVMEYMSGGSLKDILDAIGPFPEDAVAIIMKALCKGLSYIHREQKLHRDIKAANILLTNEASVKLADFGVAGQMTNTLRARNTYVGSPFWMAPEVIERSTYDQTADIWSVGITCIELLKSKPPYTDKHVYMALDSITRNDPPRLDASFSKNAREFVALCLARNPKDRASADQLVEHAFVKKAPRKPEILKALLIKKDEQLRERQKLKGGSKDSMSGIDLVAEDIIDGSNNNNQMSWEFDSGTDSNAGTVRINNDDDFGAPTIPNSFGHSIGSADTILAPSNIPTRQSSIGSADTIVAPPQPPLHTSFSPSPVSSKSTTVNGNSEVVGSMVRNNSAKRPPVKSKSKSKSKKDAVLPPKVVSVADEDSGLLAELCLPVLANLRGKAVESASNQDDLARALGQLEIAFVHAELAKPGLCAMFFRELLTAATTSESTEIRNIVATTVPKKFVKSKSSRR